MSDNNLSSSQFIKPYSRGQITIPQEYRDFLGINEKTWLFMAVKDKSLIIKPVEEKEILEKKGKYLKSKISFKQYKNMVLKTKGSFGQTIVRENQQIRRQVEDKLKKLHL